MLSDIRMPPRGSTALILARYSSNRANPLSAEDQIAACKAKCDEYGWIVTGIFNDEAKSGRVVANRSGYLEMMVAVEEGHGQVIVATALDWIGRDARELHDARNRLMDVDVVISTLRQRLMRRFEFAFYAEMAQLESERMGERTSFGQRAATARGRVMGDLAYGYRAVYDSNGVRMVEVDPVTSLIVLRINRDYVAGLSPLKIAAALTAEGIPSPEGKPVWSPNTILGTRRSGNGPLRNPLHIGKLKSGKTTVTRHSRTGKQIRRKARPEDIVEVDMPHLRILPDELWFEVQDLLNSRAAKPTQRESRRPDYLLSGLTKCGMCGGAFAMTTDRLGCVNRRVQKCTNARRVDRQEVERLVLDGLRNRIVRSPIIHLFLPEYLKELEEARKEAEGLAEVRTGRLAEVDREIANLLKQVRDGASGYAVKLLNENLDALGAERERLDRQARAPAVTKTAPLGPDEVVARLRVLFDDFGAALSDGGRDAARARDVIRSMITRIDVSPIGDPKKRGGAVTVAVEGALAAVVQPAILGRQTLPVRSTADRQDLPSAGYCFYAVIPRSRHMGRTILAPGGDDTPILALLTGERRPFPLKEVIEALQAVDGFARLSPEEQRKRADSALRRLKSNGLAHSFGRGIGSGWVADNYDKSGAAT